MCCLYIDALLMGKGWPALSGHWLSCAGCWLYLLSIKLLMCGTLFLHTYLGCLGHRLSLKKRIGQVISDLFHMRVTYYTKVNHQGCSRLSNWFSVWRFYGGSLLGLPFQLSVGVKVENGGEGFSIDFLPLFMFYTSPKFCLLFFLSNKFPFK